MKILRSVWVVAVCCAFACSNSATTSDAGSSTSDAGPTDSGTIDAGSHDPGAMDAGPIDSGPVEAGSVDAGALTGFVFSGPLDAGAIVPGTSYVFVAADDGGPAGATIGSPCSSGNDCAALGASAGCMASGDGGFCTISCNFEETNPCPTGAMCSAIAQDPLSQANQFYCLQTCTGSQDCTGSGQQCSGGFVEFTANGPIMKRACFPSCHSDADCNSASTRFTCDPATHTCENPQYDLGASCKTDQDCRGVGPGGSCLHSTRDSSNGYCTVACDPSAAAPCATGTCISGYAVGTDGGGVPVCLKNCARTSDCQNASKNTCNYFPSQQKAYCTIACTTDADCPSGTCDVASGACRTDFGTACTADSNCSTGLCVTDFHRPEVSTCSKWCSSDSDCAGFGVCVTSPCADNADGMIDGGFCAPACSLDGGATCPGASSCHAPANPPEIDFAASGSTSGDFCWQ